MKKIAILLMVLSVAVFGRSSANTMERHIAKYTSNINTHFRDVLSILGSSSSDDVFIEVKKDETVNGDAMSTLAAGNSLSVIVTADRRGVKSMVFVGIPDGSGEGSMIVALSAAASVSSLVRRHASAKQRGWLTSRLLKPVSDGETHKFRYHGYKITTNFSRYTGLMVTADRIK